MDCCSTKNNNSKLENRKLKGGQRNMNSRITLWVVIGILFVIALFFIFRAGAGSAEILQTTGSAVKTSASSGMVGGC
ncbi:hypothetical protein J4221_00815 [Candidatus Pacearchaeota archaeon]|nr:hypothetical protein [Candidatus Pacearchaeota archaeon]